MFLFSPDMNRHHYSLYVHNCRLIFLLRQDPSEAETYKPAEFHWKLDQVSRLLCRLRGFPVIGGKKKTKMEVSDCCSVCRCVTKNGITTSLMWSSPPPLCLWTEQPSSPSSSQRTTRCTPPRSKLSLPLGPAGKVNQMLHNFLFMLI